MNIQKISIDKLHPARYNPRADLKPGDPEYDMLVKGIGEFGLVVPLVWNKRSGNLVGGHQRLKVLKQAGIKEVQVSVVDLPDDKEQALNIALNKLSGEWDMPALKDLIEGLDTGDIDMDLTGWGEEEIENLMTLFPPNLNIEEKNITPLPKMAWCLIGITLKNYHQIAEYIERIALNDGTIMESTLNDQTKIK